MNIKYLFISVAIVLISGGIGWYLDIHTVCTPSLFWFLGVVTGVICGILLEKVQ